MNSMTKEDATAWALDQMNIYGIRHTGVHIELMHLNNASDLFISNLLNENSAERDNT